MYKFILSFLFLSFSVCAMGYQANEGLEKEITPGKLLDVNKQNLTKDLTEKLDQENGNLRWYKAYDIVYDYLANLERIQMETRQMNLWALQGGIICLSDVDLASLNVYYQMSIKYIIGIANEIRKQVFEMTNSKGEKSGLSITINSVGEIIAQLSGTNLLTHENATIAKNALWGVSGQLEKAYKDQAKNLAAIDLQREKDFKDWKEQIKQSLEILQKMRSLP